MLNKLLKKLEQKREALIDVKDYGVYSSRNVEAIYNDNHECYNITSQNKRNIYVSTVDSFIDFIREEFKRADNNTGNISTVIINSSGGHFCADDDFKNITCEYQRSLTAGWKALENVANHKINHEQLLTVLQKLRPYIDDFENLYFTLLDIRTIGRSEMVSNPVFFAGENGFGASSGYKITYKLQSGNQEESILPSRFTVNLPYSRGRQDILYEVPIELMYLNNGNGSIEVLFQIPELEQIEEQALQDEVEYLENKLGEFKDLLVLLNY